MSLRSCLEDIASTPYNFRYGWKIHAICESENSPVVLHHIHNEDRKPPVESRLANYYAHCFKAYAIGMMNAENDEAVVNTRVEFRNFVKRQLGSTSIAFAAQVDAVDKESSDGKNPRLKDYVKLRSCEEYQSEPEKKLFYGNKLRKLWFQAFLAEVVMLLWECVMKMVFLLVLYESKLKMYRISQRS